MSTPWRYIDTGPGSGEFNMQFDATLATQLLEGAGIPTLRLYQWRPWAISLGYNQNRSDIDTAKCERQGIDVVRRPTGGRAILHSQELTYSVVMRSGRSGVLQIYNEISRALVRGLQLFGVDVSLHRGQPNLAETYRQSSGIPCFTSSSRYEIEYEGRKLVGSAQRRYGDGGDDIVLQHGSILCGPAHQGLAEYLVTGDAASKKVVGEDLRRKTADLASLLGRDIQPDVLAPCIKKGFEQEWGITFVEFTDSEPTHDTLHAQAITTH